MGTWKTRGLRGSTLEDLINRTNERYLENHLALIQKIPTPITPVEMDKEKGHITLAYFDKKSTVDYMGIVQEIAICFDAKECAEDTFTLRNIHEHQVNFMEEFERQGGVAFFVIYYTHKNLFYYLPFRRLKEFWTRFEQGGRKSFTFDETEDKYFLKPHGGLLVPYLDGLQTDLDERE